MVIYVLFCRVVAVVGFILCFLQVAYSRNSSLFFYRIQLTLKFVFHYYQVVLNMKFTQNALNICHVYDLTFMIFVIICTQTITTVTSLVSLSKTIHDDGMEEEIEWRNSHKLEMQLKLFWEYNIANNFKTFNFFFFFIKF